MPVHSQPSVTNEVYIMTEEKIGHCIRIAMAMKDITAPELAKKLDVTKQTAYSYVQGKCDSLLKLHKVAAACDLTYDDMMALSDKAGGAQ